jgi:transcriptional regulator with XRE-family HTH domain
MTKYAQIGVRLRAFGDSRFSSMAEFARALEVTPTYLSHYLSGRARPGNVVQAKLRGLGCNLEWLMTGEKGEQKHRVCTPEEEAILIYVHPFSASMKSDLKKLRLPK